MTMLPNTMKGAAFAPERLGVRSHAQIALQLDAARGAVEQQFLQAGETLGRAVEGVSKLIRALDEFAKAFDPATVAATAGELHAAAASLMALPETQARRRTAIERIARQMCSLSDSVGDMRRTLAYLQIFAINIKITAGGIAAAGADFGLFAQEIHDRIDQGRRELNSLEMDLAALSHDLDTAINQEGALGEYCSDLLPSVPDGLVAGAAEFSSHHEGVLRIAVEVGLLTRDVQRKVGATLAALQIGDITRQRIEHVQQAIAAAAAIEDLEPEALQRLQALMSRLLAAQLTATAADFHIEVDRIGKNLTGIANDATEILRLRNLAMGQSGDSRDKGFMKRMEEHVNHAASLVDRLAHADIEAVEVGHASAAAAGDLNTKLISLQDIKTDVQQMAMNTTLKCQRLGDAGRPLAVIAVEVRLHASEMEASAKGALDLLQSLARTADDLAGEVREGDAECAGQALTDAAARIRAISDAVEINLRELVSQGESIVEILRNASARPNFKDDIGAFLDQASDDMAAIAGSEEIRANDLQEPLAKLLEAISKSYTMASEREVHRIFAMGLDIAVAPMASPAVLQPANDPDDVLF